MGDLVVDIRATGDRRFVTDVLSDVGDAASDLRPAFQEILQEFLGEERVKFAGDGEGEWEPLDARYAAQKHRSYPGRGLLQRTGRLEAAAEGGAGLHVLMTELRLKASIFVPTRDGKNEASFVTHRRSIVTVDEVTRRRWLAIVEQRVVDHTRRAAGPDAEVA